LYEKALDKAQIELDTFKDNDKTHVVVNYVHMQPGQIMTDTGCRASVAGEEWHRELTELIESFGLGEKIVEIAQEEAFKFGDGKAVVIRARRVYPVGIRGRLYMLSVSVVPNNCPGLMSYEQLEQLEGVISLKDRKVELLGEWGSLDMSSSGHPLIKLTEYPPHVRTAVAMNMEATQVYITSVSSSDEEGYETGEESGEDAQPEESDAETDISDETVTTDHSGPASDTESETESEAEEQRTYEQDVLSTMPTKYMSKSQ
jgi:hypothetical protein